jgi:hypothetical protein
MKMKDFNEFVNIVHSKEADEEFEQIKQKILEENPDDLLGKIFGAREMMRLRMYHEWVNS